ETTACESDSREVREQSLLGCHPVSVLGQTAQLILLSQRQFATLEPARPNMWEHSFSRMGTRLYKSTMMVLVA
ncbi:MAG: hypothetical protein ACRD6N_11070, partial [Pyrinomonadaceae bacterium]